MAVEKYIGFAAPYRSSTFNSAQDLILGSNGILSGGAVTASGGIATIQPFAFIQNGGIRNVTLPISATMPTQLQPPYFIAVSNQTMINNPSETLTPFFIKRPEDVVPTVTLIATWDGAEWIPMPHIGSSDIVSAADELRNASGIVGVLDGFFTSPQNPTTLVTTPGRAVDVDGVLFKKTRSSTFTIPGQDYFNTLAQDQTTDRLDMLVLRKAQDSKFRPAYLKYVTGTWGGPLGYTFPTETSSDVIAAATATAKIKIIGTTSGSVYYVGADLNGVGSSVYLGSNAVDGSANTIIATMVSDAADWDACMNPDGSIDFVYVLGNDLYYKRYGTDGTVIFDQTDVYLSTGPIYRPQIVPVNVSGTYFLHIVFEKYLSVSQKNLMYARRSSSNTEETAATILVNLSANLANASLEKDDDDALLFVAFENSDTNRIYLRTYDASTATQASIPAQIGMPIELQDDTLYGHITLAATGATQPIVKRTSTKETYVLWRQFIGSGTYVTGIWNDGYIDQYGHKAIALGNSIDVDNGVQGFDVIIDDLSFAHIVMSDQTNNIRLMTVQLESPVESQLRYNYTAIVSAMTVPATTLSVFKTTTGAIVTGYGNGDTNEIGLTRIAATFAVTKSSPVLPVSDVLITEYSSFDDAIYNKGTWIEESTPVFRLYEQNNLFASTGSVTWTGTTSTLVMNDDIELKMVHKYATYQIVANTTIIPDGSVMVVPIPDGDFAGTAPIVPLVEKMGDLALDRTRKTYYPLFWNFGGVLYSRFAPFRIDGDGTTVIVGQGLTEKMKAWLGTTVNDPDPDNHGYASTVYIAQNTSHNDALGLLDAAIAGKVSGAIGVQAIDPVSTTLPVGNPILIDNVTINAGDLALFTNLASDNNEVYIAVGTGTDVTSWTAQPVFSGHAVAPTKGALIYAEGGDIYAENYLYYNGTDWKNLLNNKFEQTLLDNQTDATLIIMDKTQTRNFAMEFSILRGNSSEVGMLFATHNDVSAAATEPLFTGVGGASGVSFDAQIVGDYFVITYSTTSTGSDATLDRTIRIW